MADIDNNKLGLLIISWGGYWAKNLHKRKEKAKTMSAPLDEKKR